MFNSYMIGFEEDRALLIAEVPGRAFVVKDNQISRRAGNRTLELKYPPPRRIADHSSLSAELGPRTDRLRLCNLEHLHVRCASFIVRSGPGFYYGGADEIRAARKRNSHYFSHPTATIMRQDLWRYWAQQSC